MKEAIDHLRKIISEHSEMLQQISEERFSQKPTPEKWNKKEELGHLIDSAHNNLRRFMVAQYEENPKIVYDQNLWVEAGNYNFQHSSDLIELWRSLNVQVCEVLQKMPEPIYKKNCDTGKGKIELHSLEWLAADYVTHLLHHLHVILDLEPVAYP